MWLRTFDLHIILKLLLFVKMWGFFFPVLILIFITVARVFSNLTRVIEA